MKLQFKKPRRMAAVMMACILLSSGSVAQAETPDQKLMADLTREVKAAFSVESGFYEFWLGIMKKNFNRERLQESTKSSLELIMSQYKESCAKFAGLKERASAFSDGALASGFAATVEGPMQWCATRQRMMSHVKVLISFQKPGITVGTCLNTVTKTMAKDLGAVQRLQGELAGNLQRNLSVAGLSPDLGNY